jgi:hypothetical protein
VTMSKRKEDMLKQTVHDLTYELDKVRDNDVNNASFMSNNSFQQTIISELELKVLSLVS